MGLTALERELIRMRLVVAICLLLVTAPARAGEKVTLVLDWLVNPDHAALVIAQAKGFFAARGLDVALVAPSDPSDPPKLVAAGRADAGIYYQPQLYLALDQGLSVARIATLIDGPLNSVLVLADGPVKTLADLAGRKIGYSVDGFDTALLSVMLDHAGVASDRVERVNVNFSLAPALLAGHVDAVIGAFRNVEPHQIALQGKAPKIFPVEEAGIPAYDELILIAAQDRLADVAFRSRMTRLVAAIEEGALYVVNHPDDSWRLFVSAHRELDDGATKRAWSDTIARLALSPAALDRGRYARFAEFLMTRGVIKTMPDLAKAAVTLD